MWWAQRVSNYHKNSQTSFWGKVSFIKAWLLSFTHESSIQSTLEKIEGFSNIKVDLPKVKLHRQTHRGSEYKINSAIAF